MRAAHDIAHKVCLVLHKHQPLAAKGLQRAIHIVLRQLLVCAAIEENAVLTVVVHLNNGVAGDAGGTLRQREIHPVFIQLVIEHIPVATDQPRVPDLRACARRRDGLVKPLAAAMGFEGQAGLGLAGLHKRVHAIHLVQIQGTEVENVSQVRLPPYDDSCFLC
ncbi:hypothetical protein SDC9_146332 [bioreactor metagenome]|uniref:Uncharacterized protein n=1 Tax=bioreactor metagenome TaxID=1076179 RepID=A0A645ECR8_9ZZZZ